MDASSEAQKNLHQLAQLLHQVAGKDPAKIQLSTRLVEDLNLESLEMLELLFEAEEKFGLTVDIPSESIADIKTVEDLLNALLATR